MADFERTEHLRSSHSPRESVASVQMQLRPLLLWGILLVGTGPAFADALAIRRAMESLREDKVRREKDLAEVRRDLASTIKKQRDNAKAARAAELQKMRIELEATVHNLEGSVRDMAEKLAKNRATLDTRHPCPICGGKLTRIKNVAHKNQHRNRDVWPRASRWVPVCGNVSYLDDSPICTRCWAAQTYGRDVWTQSSTEARAFVVPLTPGLANVPMPLVGVPGAKWAFWRRQEANGKRSESASIRLEKAPAEYVASLEKHAREHGLEFRDNSTLGPSHVITISTPRQHEEPEIPLLR